MFQFPAFAFSHYIFNIVGSPIRTSADYQSFAFPRSFSQLTTSFVASESLGIPRTPLFASFFLSPNILNASCILFIMLSLLVNELFDMFGLQLIENQNNHSVIFGIRTRSETELPN